MKPTPSSSATDATDRFFHDLAGFAQISREEEAAFFQQIAKIRSEMNRTLCRSGIWVAHVTRPECIPATEPDFAGRISSCAAKAAEAFAAIHSPGNSEAHDRMLRAFTTQVSAIGDICEAIHFAPEVYESFWDFVAEQEKAAADARAWEILNWMTKDAFASFRSEVRRMERKISKIQGQLMTANLKFVVSEAKKYAKPEIPILDLIQEGSIAFGKAVAKYNPTFNARICTFAGAVIKGALRRYIDNHERTVRTPVHVCESLRKLNKAKHELSVEYGEEPSVGNLAWKMNIDQTEVRELLSYQQSIISLDFVQEDAESTSLLERLPDENAWNPCIAMDTEHLQEQLAPYMAVLSEREREVLQLRLGMGQPRGEFMPAETVAAILNIRPASVADVERRAIRKIRKFRAGFLNQERGIA